jgi:hypothetical protein
MIVFVAHLARCLGGPNHEIHAEKATASDVEGKGEYCSE